MIWSLTPSLDTTIYEKDVYRNSGLDQILELKKEGDASTGDLTESRILMKFDLSTLSSILSENNITINDISASLRLYTVQESEVPLTHTLEARAIAYDWRNGSGYTTYPETVTATTVTDGVSWNAVSGINSATWATVSASNPGTRILFNSSSTAGGGVWLTSSLYLTTQSFNFKTDDYTEFDLTNLVKYWVSGSISNYGIVISFKNSEIAVPYTPLTTIQYYSSDTHTVYSPQLFINWTGSLTYSTGSVSVLTYEDSPVIYTRNFRNEFPKGKKIRILLGSRPKYPRASFAQNSVFSTIKLLPQESYYQIKDAHSNEIVIPYSSFTKLNTNSSGSYFDLYTTMLYAERYYRFEIKSTFNDVTEYFDSNDFIFKIVK